MSRENQISLLREVKQRLTDNEGSGYVCLELERIGRFVSPDSLEFDPVWKDIKFLKKWIESMIRFDAPHWSTYDAWYAQVNGLKTLIGLEYQLRQGRIMWVESMIQQLQKYPENSAVDLYNVECLTTHKLYPNGNSACVPPDVVWPTCL